MSLNLIARSLFARTVVHHPFGPANFPNPDADSLHPRSGNPGHLRCSQGPVHLNPSKRSESIHKADNLRVIYRYFNFIYKGTKP